MTTMPTPNTQRKAQHRNKTYESGLAAERGVARQYLRRGMQFRAHRWRGRGGEIDIVFADGDVLVFVEVKKARNFHRAAQSLSQRQITRITRSAEEYAGTQPRGSLSEMRFDLAMVNDAGQVSILENAFGAM